MHGQWEGKGREGKGLWDALRCRLAATCYTRAYQIPCFIRLITLFRINYFIEKNNKSLYLEIRDAYPLYKKENILNNCHVKKSF